MCAQTCSQGIASRIWHPGVKFQFRALCGRASVRQSLDKSVRIQAAVWRQEARPPRSRIRRTTLEGPPRSTLEPCLRPESPESGNYSMNGRRLPAFSAGCSVNWESGDRLRIAKARKWRAFLRQVEAEPPTRPTAWLGREDSNLRMGESKSPALPLGDAPIDLSGKWRNDSRAVSLRQRRSIERA